MEQQADGRRRARTILLWIVTILISLGIGLAGLMKFLQPDHWQSLFAGWGYPKWFSSVVGVAEVVGAVGLLIPRLALYAVMVLVIVMTGALISLLTGFAFAIAIVGAALFVDRVLYGGPDEQQIALGALAGATALGALVSGFAIRILSLRLVSLVGLAASAGALFAMGGWTSGVALATVSALLALFGLGFGLTVTPRSTADRTGAGLSAGGRCGRSVFHELGVERAADAHGGEAIFVNQLGQRNGGFGETM